MRLRAFVLTLGLAVPATAVHADVEYRLLAGRDTVAIERAHVQPSWLKGALFVRAAGVRMTYVLAIADERPSTLELSVWPIAAPDRVQPTQSARCEFLGDSVSVVAGPKRQRFGGASEAWPFVNPSMAMLSLALQHSALARRDSADLRFFLLNGGSVATARAWRLGADSVRVALNGVEMRLATDRTGAITGGSVPSQGVRIEVGPATGALPTITPPDYSAPPGAPYTAETVKVPVGGRFELAGTLTQPKGATRAVPCVVTITGSGLEDRDEAIPIVSGYRPFRQIADALARRGIATLRLDDRGTGESGGDPSEATTADFADDVRAALAWLRARPGIDGHRLALLGHSEGGLIAPMVAADDSLVRAIVLLAAPARTGRRVIAYQQRQAIARDSTLDAATRAARVQRAMAQVDSMATMNAWLRYLLDYDPLVTARRVPVPVLILQGANDRQVEAPQANELASAMRAAGHRDVTVAVLPGVNHLFLPDPSGDPVGYPKLAVREIPSPILQRISDWLAARLR